MSAESAEGKTGAANTREASWRRYPRLEAAIESESPAVMVEVERTRLQIESLSRTGATWEKQRANTALMAYDRALKLYGELTRRRDQMLRGASNIGVKAAISE